MAAAPTPAPDNPFDEPLAGSSVQAPPASDDDDNPFSAPLAASKQSPAEPKGDRAIPNARIRNMSVDPTKDAKTGLDAFLGGAKTGTELAAIPSSAAAAEMGPIAGKAVQYLSHLDNIVKAAKALGYGGFALKEAHEL